MYKRQPLHDGTADGMISGFDKNQRVRTIFRMRMRFSQWGYRLKMERQRPIVNRFKKNCQLPVAGIRR
jgi:hypothetical protein